MRWHKLGMFVKSSCVLFHVKLETVHMDSIIHVWWKPLWRVRKKSVEKAENRAAEWTKVSASLCTNKTLVETLDLMQVHFFDFKLFMLALLLFEFFFSKGRATHPVKTFCVFSVSIFFSRSKIIYLLRFKLFLTIFKCIYVSFFTLTVCRFWLHTYCCQ